MDDIASQQIEVQTVENFGDSFSVHNVEPVRRTYARKRTSTNAQNPSNRPSSANATKKTRSKYSVLIFKFQSHCFNLFPCVIN